jgi:small GTP-binding protein
MIKTVVANGIKIKLQLWDTAGQERFRSITQSYYRSAHCLILVYDISSQPSFDALSKWIRDVDSVLDRDTQLGSEVLRVLVGNKCDKEREIPYAIGEKFATMHKFDLFMETSALNNESVDKLFYDVAEILALRRKDEPTASLSPIPNNQQKHADQSSSGVTLGIVDSINNLNLANRAWNCLQC